MSQPTDRNVSLAAPLDDFGLGGHGHRRSGHRNHHGHRDRRGDKSNRQNSFSSLSPPMSPPVSPPLASMLRHPDDDPVRRSRQKAKLNGMFPKSRR